MEVNTWVLVNLRIFKRKRRMDGTIERLKSQLVKRDFNQSCGIDHFDSYAPIVRIEFLSLLLQSKSQ